MHILFMIHISNVIVVNPKDFNLFSLCIHNISNCLLLYFQQFKSKAPCKFPGASVNTEPAQQKLDSFKLTTAKKHLRVKV